MKIIDTNLLVRLITNDVPAQREQAASTIQACRAGEILLPDIVLTELFFVLESRMQRYAMHRRSICAALYDVLLLPQLTITPEATQAMGIAVEHPELDFTDCLLAIYAGQQTHQLLSFDKDLLKILRYKIRGDVL